ncbi:MAG: urease accessory protein UreD [Mycobacterium sp.]|jgi:urease accessory protein|nr:urease accessory protein UreD [Mycobacterium sp.]
MRSDVRVVAYRDRAPRIECRGGIAARLTADDAVHLVSTAATPLGGDVIRVHLIVEAGARLHLRSVAATVALPAATTLESQVCWRLEVAGELDVDPQPTVVAADACHESQTTLYIGSGAVVRLRERVQIGRTDEREGLWTGTLRADLDGAALLRHRVELGAGSVADDELGAPLACVSEFRYPADETDLAAVPLRLAGGGCLSTWQGASLPPSPRFEPSTRSPRVARGACGRTPAAR